MITAYDFHVILKNAGLPITGVSLEPLRVTSWATEPSVEQEAQAAALLNAARIAEFSMDGHTLTVTTVPPASEIALWIGGEAYTLPLTNGAGSVNIIFPEGVTSRTVKAQNQAVYGYLEIIVNA